MIYIQEGIEGQLEFDFGDKKSMEKFFKMIKDGDGFCKFDVDLLYDCEEDCDKLVLFPKDFGQECFAIKVPLFDMKFNAFKEFPIIGKK